MKKAQQIQIQAEENVFLSTWITQPTEQPLRALALILPGSGNVSYDGDVSGPFLGGGYQGQPALLSVQLADALAQEGVASLRYSKRGVDDPAQLPQQRFPFLLQDAQKALEQLRARFPNLPVLLVGLSEGSLIATHLAATQSVAGLLLLGFLSRPIRDAIRYQFTGWPVALIRKALDPQNTDQVGSEHADTLLPLLGEGLVGTSVGQFLEKRNQREFSITHDLIPAYLENYKQVEALLESPAIGPWVASFDGLPELRSVQKKISCPVVLYHGSEDAQIPWQWAQEDQKYFSGPTHFHVMPELGHCFAPHEGKNGEIKTSGPLDQRLLDAIRTDVSGWLASNGLRRDLEWSTHADAVVNSKTRSEFRE